MNILVVAVGFFLSIMFVSSNASSLPPPPPPPPPPPCFSPIPMRHFGFYCFDTLLEFFGTFFYLLYSLSSKILNQDNPNVDFVQHLLITETQMF